MATGLFVALFGLLLASFPARNPELWASLAGGRELLRGSFAHLSPTWLYEVVSYGLFQSVGGGGLVAVKAGLVALLAVVLMRVSRTSEGWFLAAAATVLAVLTVGNRALLAPATVSYFLLAVAVARAWRATATGFWPGWLLVGLFFIWGNTDRWFLLGLGVVALVELGRCLDGGVNGGRGILRALAMAAILAVAALANPANLKGFTLPAELGWDPATRQAVNSPFERAYLATLAGSPAALAYYPLLGLSLVSFLLVLPRWRWQRFLPWVTLAALSAFQVRTTPFFAVVAGPVLAWNLQDFFARRVRPDVGPAWRAVAAGLTAILAVAFLGSAWTGWLQRPPFEPRRWAVPPLAGLEHAASAVRRGHSDGVWPAGTRTLHLSRDTQAAFAWFCPEDDGLFDPLLAKSVAGGEDEPSGAARIGRVVVQTADRGLPREALARLLADPERWPLLHLESGVQVFGRRDAPAAGRPDPFRGREVDLDRLAFQPAESEKAPFAPTTGRRWWDAFWKPASTATGDRDQAAVLLLKAEIVRGSAPRRHLATWDADQTAALTAAAAGWANSSAMADAALRLSLFRPPLPVSGDGYAPITLFTLDCRQLVELNWDDAPPGVLYAAVRAARRAAAANPDDANAQLLLGQCYLALLSGTRERAWALRLPRLAQLRQAQASAALNRALTLNPNLAQAHNELGHLYRQTGYLDLALTHLRAYGAAARRGGADAGQEAVPESELKGLKDNVDRQFTEFDPESVRARVVDRARAAVTRGLAGKALAILLESDFSAFGAEGAELELDLLLRTGRAGDVLDWADAYFKQSLGPAGYHWLRTQAFAAIGDYGAADAELLASIGVEEPDPARIAGVFAMLTGRSLLDEQPIGEGLASLVARAYARIQFWSGMEQTAARLAERSDAAVFRGLLALEAGEVDRARAAFRAALAYTPDSSAEGGLDFPGRSVARDGLRILGK